MNKDSILFLTKDALVKSYLPCYGNKYYIGQTPNLDEIASKGTTFQNFYTAAPSSSMSYLSMFTMRYPYTHEIRTYVPLLKHFVGDSLFDKAYQMGFDCHVIWDESWIKSVYQYTKCYGIHTSIHSLKNFRQPVGSHYQHKGLLIRNEQLATDTLDMFQKVIDEIVNSENKVFIWCHLPHVLNGRVSYGDDIDLYDRYLGVLRQYFNDNNIFISADHGNMNGLKGKIGYGFDVYDTTINIPLITPRIDGLKECSNHVCNIDVFDLIFNRIIREREIIFSDSAYYAQPNRKLAVIWCNYRYIYNKITKTEELYDVEWDPNQNFNLIKDDIYDVDRNVTTLAREYYFYPYWDNLPAIRKKLRVEKDKIWREASESNKKYYYIYRFLSKNRTLKKWLKPLAKIIKIYS